MDSINIKSLQEWRNSMNTNGYSHFDETEFLKKSSYPCYIAENAESLDDMESYQSMYDMAIAYINSNWQTVAILETERHGVNATPENIPMYAETILNSFFDDMAETWVFFSTYLEDYYNH